MRGSAVECDNEDLSALEHAFTFDKGGLQCVSSSSSPLIIYTWFLNRMGEGGNAKDDKSQKEKHVSLFSSS